MRPQGLAAVCASYFEIALSAHAAYVADCDGDGRDDVLLRIDERRTPLVKRVSGSAAADRCKVLQLRADAKDKPMHRIQTSHSDERASSIQARLVAVIVALESTDTTGTRQPSP